MEGKTKTLDADVTRAAGASGSVNGEPGPLNPSDPASVMTEALAWIEENQTLAMLGAFALGVFIGAMMRD